MGMWAHGGKRQSISGVPRLFVVESDEEMKHGVTGSPKLVDTDAQS